MMEVTQCVADLLKANIICFCFLWKAFRTQKMSNINPSSTILRVKRINEYENKVTRQFVISDTCPFFPLRFPLGSRGGWFQIKPGNDRKGTLTLLLHTQGGADISSVAPLSSLAGSGDAHYRSALALGTCTLQTGMACP